MGSLSGRHCRYSHPHGLHRSIEQSEITVGAQKTGRRLGIQNVWLARAYHPSDFDHRTGLPRLALASGKLTTIVTLLCTRWSFAATASDLRIASCNPAAVQNRGAASYNIAVSCSDYDTRKARRSAQRQDWASRARHGWYFVQSPLAERFLILLSMRTVCKFIPPLPRAVEGDLQRHLLGPRALRQGWLDGLAIRGWLINLVACCWHGCGAVCATDPTSFAEPETGTAGARTLIDVRGWQP